MKKKLSIIGTIIFLAGILLPIFQPVLTAMAEEMQPKLLTVYHNGKKVKDDEEIEVAAVNQMQLKATGDFTLTIPENDDYEFSLLSDEEQTDVLDQVKKKDKVSFDVRYDEETGYQLEFKKGMTLYFNVTLLNESAVINGTASFAPEKIPDAELTLIQFVKPKETKTSSDKKEKTSETEKKASEEAKGSETKKESEEPKESKKEIVFYKDDKLIDKKKKVTIEEGEEYNPSENVTAKTKDGSEEYPVEVEVKKDGKTLTLEGENFVPEEKTNYSIQYRAMDGNEAIATMGIGVQVSNGSVNVSLEWVTGNPSYISNQDYIVGQTGSGVTAIPYRVNISTTGQMYEPGQLELRLPASQFQFSDSTGVSGALGWNTRHISLLPYAQVTTQTFGYEISADNQTLIIKNVNKITGTIQESFEISTVLNSANRSATGVPQRVRARHIVHGTNAKLKFDVTDYTQTTPAKKDFSTNELKLTLKTEFAKPKTTKSSRNFDPYNEWDTSIYGNRPTDFNKYYWIRYTISEQDIVNSGKRLQIRFQDSISKEPSGGSQTQLTTAQLNQLKIITNFDYYNSSLSTSYKDFYEEDDGGLDSKSISSNAIKWQVNQNRGFNQFKNATLSIINDFVFLVGYPKANYKTTDKIYNKITTQYYDADDKTTYYDTNTAQTSTTLKDYSFAYPPGAIVGANKVINSKYGLSDRPNFYTDSGIVNRDLVVNLLQSGTEVEMRTASLYYTVNHPNGNDNPFAMTMYDDNMTWKANDTSTVKMTHEDYYFKQINLLSETVMPNKVNNTNQDNGVPLPNLRLEYQDDNSGVWKKHPTLITPNVYKNRGVNPDGSTYDIYSWGELDASNKIVMRMLKMSDFGIKPYRFRFVTVNDAGTKAGVYGRVDVKMEANISIYGVNPNDNKQTQLEKWIAAGNDTSTIQLFNFLGYEAESKGSGNTWTVLNPDDQNNNTRLESDIQEYGHYLYRKEGNAILQSTSPTSKMRKTAKQVNNVAEKRNDITWTIDWVEGYDGTNSDATLKELIDNGILNIPLREKIVIYDLIPAGHSFQSVDELYYRDQKLNNSQYTSAIVSNNYNNSGRQLIQITIDGKSITNKSGMTAFTEVQPNGLKIRGNNFSLQYKTQVTWADRLIANENFSSSNRNSVTVSLFDDKNKAQVMMDGGKTRTEVNNELKTSSGLDNSGLGYVPSVGTGNTNIKNSMNDYGAIEITGETAVQAGLTKYVKGNRPESGFSESDHSVHTADGTYQYRLDYIADAADGAGNYVKDVVLFDKIERVETPNSQGYTQGWRGVVDSIDLSYARSLGIDAKVYVSMLTSKEPFAPGGGAFTDSGWTKWENVAESGKQNIQMIAIDLSKKIGGGDYVFTKNEYVNITINMKMPTNFPTQPKAYNVPWLSATKYTSNQPSKELTEATYTDFELTRNYDLKIVKQDLQTPSKKLNGVVFEIEYPDGTKKNHTTSGGTSPNFLGEINLSSLDPGTYKLREKSTIAGYELLAETYTFTIKNDGTITHQTDSAYWKYNKSDNQITLTVNNRRKFTLPITGGPGGISLLLLLAIAVVVGTGWYLKKYRFQLDGIE
ncbi:hypothetical protein NRIC_17710 [Enterococcus florum]|uniref:SpaA-like prealbumin fold domain-containing protein n=1 Tax=Enterococcus florum TaxID=2480627 RepID=A0A4P5P7S7_9ENTE|nr:prealbumin-like fold domain-containing protein [Enterococcus florum]GCF93880.1 hypothetical protein NRIC_17710 [Enterococcus florum]